MPCCAGIEVYGGKAKLCMNFPKCKQGQSVRCKFAQLHICMQYVGGQRTDLSETPFNAFLGLFHMRKRGIALLGHQPDFADLTAADLMTLHYLPSQYTRSNHIWHCESCVFQFQPQRPNSPNIKWRRSRALLPEDPESAECFGLQLIRQ